MNKMKMLFHKVKNKLLFAIKRYPAAIFLLLFAAFMVMLTIDINNNGKNISDEPFIKLAMSSLYGAILSLVIKSAAERFEFKKATEWMIQASVPISMALIYFYLLPDFDSMTAMVKYCLLCLLTASLFFFIPFIRSEKSASYFAQKVLLRLAVTMIYYGIITGGVEAIIFAIENLLSVNVPNEIYSQTAVALAGLFIPSFFFAGIPSKQDAQDNYPKLLKILLHYIVFPLLSAYTVVLYAYFIKILVEFTLPSNLLGNLVIYYSLISIAALYFGAFTKDESRWTSIFNIIFPYVLIVPTLMMLLSFAVRINQYGFTEARYYAILVVIFVLRSITVIKLQKKVNWIPLTLSILLLVSIFGPLSSFNVSMRSQNNRFERILTQAGMLEGGKIIPNSDASENTKNEITQIVSYFDSNHSTEELRFIDEQFGREQMKEYFGFDGFYISKYPQPDRNYIFGDYEKFNIIATGPYDFFTEIYPKVGNFEFESGDQIFELSTGTEQDYYLVISSENVEIYKKDMLEILMPFFESSGGSEVPGEYIFTDETDKISVKMIILNAEYEKEQGYLYYDIKLLFSIKN